MRACLDYRDRSPPQRITTNDGDAGANGASNGDDASDANDASGDDASAPRW
jgi:hypothetical protein